MEGRALPDLNSIVSCVASYLNYHGVVNLFYHQEVLDAPHGYPKLN